MSAAGPKSTCESVNSFPKSGLALFHPQIQSVLSRLKLPPMPDNVKGPNPFKPQQPLIPGVSPQPAGDEGKGPAESGLASKLKAIQLPPPWVIAAVAIALLLGVGVAWWKHGPTTKVESDSLPPSSSTAESPTARPARPSVPVGPGEVSTTEELTKPWSSKRFDFRNPSTGQLIPALVVHLPGGAYWGFSLQEPFGNCELKYTTDLKTLREQFNLTADHPMVLDPCNGSVFDLARYASAPGGLVRGEVIQGPAIRPPLAIEIRVQGHQLIAVRTE